MVKLVAALLLALVMSMGAGLVSRPVGTHASPARLTECHGKTKIIRKHGAKKKVHKLACKTYPPPPVPPQSFQPGQ